MCCQTVKYMYFSSLKIRRIRFVSFEFASFLDLNHEHLNWGEFTLSKLKALTVPCRKWKHSGTLSVIMKCSPKSCAEWDELSHSIYNILFIFIFGMRSRTFDWVLFKSCAIQKICNANVKYVISDKKNNTDIIRCRFVLTLLKLQNNSNPRDFSFCHY